MYSIYTILKTNKNITTNVTLIKITQFGCNTMLKL